MNDVGNTETAAPAGAARSLDEFAMGKLRTLEKRALRRELRVTGRGAYATAFRDGHKQVSFCCNDYLGLSQHPKVRAAAITAIEQHGAGAGASRLVTGNNPEITALESWLAEYKKTEAALVFGSGYLANVGVIPALVGGRDLVVMDELSHACMHAGARLSGAEIQTFRHNDVDHAAELLDGEAGAKLLLTETVFSMDGDRAPTRELAAVAERAGAWLMTDDAHGLGIFGPCPEVPLQMGTLSKAAGSYGGYLCASGPVIDLMKNRARPLIYSTGLPPASAAAARAALVIMSAEPERARRAMEHAYRFCAGIGCQAPQSPIVPVIVGGAQAALDASSALADMGLLVTAIRPPTVPEGTARLRVTFCADHRDSDVELLIGAFKSLRLCPS